MMYYYNMSNATDFVTLLSQINNNSGQVFGIAILFMIFFVSYFSFKDFETEKAFFTSTFITTMSALFLTILGMTSVFVLTGCFALLLGSLFLVKFVGKES